MRGWVALAALAGVSQAHAQTSQPPPAVAAQPASGVISYPASFFASAQPTNARDMVDRLPGFVFDPGDSSIRGLAGASGNVFIDGQPPASKSDDLDSVLRRVPASQVDHIDVIRGSAPGIDMRGKTVIANVVRKTGAASTALLAFANLNVIHDGRDAPAIRLEGTHRKDGTALEGSLFVGRGIDDGSGDGPRTRRDASGVPLILGKDYTLGDGWQEVATGAVEHPLFGGKFRANARYLRDRFRFNEDVYNYAPTSHEIERDHQNRDQGEIGFNYDRAFGQRTSLEAVFIQRLNGRTDTAHYANEAVVDDFRLRRTTGESIGRATVNFRYSPALSFQTGGEAAFNWLDSQTRFSENAAPIELPAADVHVSEKRGEVFGQATWKAMPTLTIEAGVRVEGSTIASTGDVVLSKTLIFPKPRLFATWSPTAEDQVRLRIERVVGQLDFGAFVASSALNTSGEVRAGNPNLNPEQAWVAEAAYERRFWKDGAAVITVRHSQLQDVVDRVPIFSPSGVFDAPGNIGTGRKDEVVFNLNLPLQRLGVPGGLLRLQETHRWSEVTDPTTGRSREISALHSSDGEFHFSQDLPKWKFRWGVDAFQGWRETSYRFSEVDHVKLRTYVIAFVEYVPVKGLNLHAEIQNLTSRGLELIQQPYAGPRNTSGLLYTDVRDLQFGPMIYLRVRKTLGG